MKKVTIGVLPPSEAARHAELGGAVPLGSAGAYALSSDSLPEDVGLAIYYPTVRALIGEISQLNWVLYDVLRMRRQPLTLQQLLGLTGEEFVLTLTHQLQVLLDLRLIEECANETFKGLYGEVEITI